MSLRYGYSCAKCGIRTEAETPLPTLGAMFICEGCRAEAPQAVRDSLDLQQQELGLWLRDNPNTHPGHKK